MGLIDEKPMSQKRRVTFPLSVADIFTAGLGWAADMVFVDVVFWRKYINRQLHSA
jgi:hypothetical protein